MTDTEYLLSEALHAGTRDIRPDPHARELIASALADAPPVATSAGGPRRTPAIVAGIAAILLVVAGVAAFVADGTGGTTQPGDVGTGGSYLPGDPLPPSRYVVATQGNVTKGERVRDVVVSVLTGRTVATLPDLDGGPIVEPQLAPDGKRAYGVWGNGTRIGYLDLISGRRTVLSRRSGEIDSPILSADGSTLAYQWTPKPDGNDVSSIVVRNLSSGRERVLAGAPSGPTALSLALSPDGRRLALVPTDRSPDQEGVELVPTTRSQAFSHPVRVPYPACRSISTDEPRWTARGLYAVVHCASRRPGPDARIVTIDPVRHRVIAIRPVQGAGTFLQLAVVERAAGPLFVTADISEPDTARVEVHDSRHARVLRTLPGVNGLAVN